MDKKNYTGMKRLYFLLMALMVLNVVQSQEKSWPQNYEALVFDKPAEELTLVYFSGSDWCKPCIKMKQEILDTKEFLTYAEKYRLYQADFPYRIKLEKAHKKFNESLAENYNPNGQFPLLAVVDGTGKLVFSTGYKDVDIKTFIELLEAGINAK